MTASPVREQSRPVRGIRARVRRDAACSVPSCWPRQPPASAQQARPSRFAIDTAAAVDHAVDGSGNHTTGLMVDAIVSVGLGPGIRGRRVANRAADRQHRRRERGHLDCDIALRAGGCRLVSGSTGGSLALRLGSRTSPCGARTSIRPSRSPRHCSLRCLRWKSAGREETFSAPSIHSAGR